jgi:hypothetical protein
MSTTVGFATKAPMFELVDVGGVGVCLGKDGGMKGVVAGVVVVSAEGGERERCEELASLESFVDPSEVVRSWSGLNR